MCVTVEIPIIGGGTLTFEKFDSDDSQVTISTNSGTLDDGLYVEVEMRELLKTIAVLGGGIFSFFNGPIEKKEEE